MVLLIFSNYFSFHVETSIQVFVIKIKYVHIYWELRTNSVVSTITLQQVQSYKIIKDSDNIIIIEKKLNNNLLIFSSLPVSKLLGGLNGHVSDIFIFLSGSLFWSLGRRLKKKAPRYEDISAKTSVSQ